MEKIILFIEDNEDIRESAAELLGLLGFRVITADGGSAALARVQENTPHLIICDISMPEMDGFEVYEALRAKNLATDVPFIFSTARSENIDREKAEMAGVAHYLVKPFTEEDLMEVIRKCL